MTKHRHTRHAHTNGNRRYTTTKSTSGRYTQSSSLKSGNVRVTTTNDNEGRSYTTVTTRYADGSYTRERLGKQPKPKGGNNTPLPMYSWEWERDPDERRPSRSFSWFDLIWMAPVAVILGYVAFYAIVFAVVFVAGFVWIMFTSLFAAFL